MRAYRYCSNRIDLCGRLYFKVRIETKFSSYFIYWFGCDDPTYYPSHLILCLFFNICNLACVPWKDMLSRKKHLVHSWWLLAGLSWGAPARCLKPLGRVLGSETFWLLECMKSFCFDLFKKVIILFFPSILNWRMTIVSSFFFLLFYVHQ